MSAERRGSNGNRIAGRTVSPAGGGRFEVLGARDGASLGSWPRSDARAVAEALAGLAEVEPPGRGDAAAACRGAARRLEEDETLLELLAARLGMDPGELEPRRSGIERRLGGGGPAASRSGAGSGGGAPSGSGVAVLAPDWAELIRGPALAVLDRLARARPVLLLADPRVPFVADRIADHVADAMDAAGLPPAALALVHGADQGARAEAVAAPGVGEVVASGAGPALARLREALGRRGDGDREVAVALAAHGTRDALVRRDDDLGAAAAHVVEEAFGRRRTLSGQLPGRVGRVRCHRRVLSAFTEALLERIEEQRGREEAVGLVDRAAWTSMEEARRLGLDEGATLIEGGEDFGDGPRRDLVFPPLVFTNVEAGMDLASQEAPGPLLRLLREPSGA